eukprot:9551603-Alexandrium_andersonii.AAC.1
MARAAPARWEALFSTTLQGPGLVRGKASAHCYHQPDHDIRCAVHGDDFAFAGDSPDWGWAETVMTESFLCKVEGRLGGDSGDLKEVRLLNVRGGPTPCRATRAGFVDGGIGVRGERSECSDGSAAVSLVPRL